MPIEILGLQIKRKTDILAFAAFLMALGTLITQLVYFFQGSDIELFPPEHVLIVPGIYPGNREFVRIVAAMTYRNSGHPIYSDVIKQEYALMKLGDSEYDFKWELFVNTSLDGIKVDIKEEGNAIPMMIRGKEVKTHETYFAPFPVLKKGVRPEKNFLQWDKFLKAISNVEELLFRFKFESYNGEEKEVLCKVAADYGFKMYLKKYNWGWAACHKIKQK